MKTFGKVAVLMGGRSSEREISLISGKAVYAALIRQGVDAHAIDVDDHLVETLVREKFDRVFIMLHGREGEDGVVQGLLEMLRIPYTGSDVQASAFGMDKVKSKFIFQGLNLPTLPFIILESVADLSKVKEKFSCPICIKPAHEGSSRGVTKVDQIENLEKAYQEAFKFDSVVMAEPWVIGRELTVAILGDQALPPVEIKAAGSFYDYEAKYFSNDTEYICPAALSQDKEKEIKKTALKAFHALGCKDFARIDFLENKKGDLFIMEVNTVPGMTDHSLVPMAAKASGISFDELVLNILEFTL
jgi:D-alanine-D-alanine ligase